MTRQNFFKDFVKLERSNNLLAKNEVELEMVYEKLYEVMDNHSNAFLIMGGDFNACMSQLDYLNRNKSQIDIMAIKW